MVMGFPAASRMILKIGVRAARLVRAESTVRVVAVRVEHRPSRIGLARVDDPAETVEALLEPNEEPVRRLVRHSLQHRVVESREVGQVRPGVVDKGRFDVLDGVRLPIGGEALARELPVVIDRVGVGHAARIGVRAHVNRIALRIALRGLRVSVMDDVVVPGGGLGGGRYAPIRGVRVEGQVAVGAHLRAHPVRLVRERVGLQVRLR